MSDEQTSLKFRKRSSAVAGLSVTAGGTFTQTMLQDCAIEQGEIHSAYCETVATISFAGEDPVEERSEVVAIGEETWIRSGDAAEWEAMPPDFMQQAGFSEDIGQVRLSEFITDTIIMGETVVGGVDVYEITFEVDVEAYFATILGEEAVATLAELSQETSGDGTMWIGQTDFYTRKTDIEMIFLMEGEEMVASTRAAYTYNEPVDIPDPRE